MCLFFNLDVAQTAGPMLVEVGRHNAAAQLYMGVEMIKEAVDAFISAEEWNKVRNLPLKNRTSSCTNTGHFWIKIQIHN